MPPKAKTTKKDIAEKAFNLIRKKGISGLTAKALAAEMKCSTQPIFWYYSGMEELKEDVYQKALSLFDNYLRTPRQSISPYKSIGLNYIRFAAEEKKCFQWLFMSDTSGKQDILSTHSEIPYVLDILEKTEKLTGEQARTVFEEMWMFVHGIAAMTATETAQFEDDKIQKMVSDVYHGLVSNLSNAQK